MRASGRPRLEVSPSLNRTVLADFPGLPAGMAGSAANSWLAAWGVARRMAALTEGRPEVVRLGASPSPAALDRLVAAGDPGGCGLADDLGLALGALLATLVTAPAEARAARPDWLPAQWERWGSVRRTAIGGGLVRGPLGVRMVSSARDWLRRRDVAVDLVLVEQPERLVLRGAATRLTGGGLVLDAGSTTVKSAVRHAGVRGAGGAGGAGSADDLEGAPVPTPSGSAEEVLDVLTAVVARLAPKLPGRDVLPVSLALATYVDETGQPYAGQLGPYAPLGELDVRAELESRIHQAVHRRVSVRVVHDGAAALSGARVDDPGVDAAIVLGTSIGSGLR